MNYYTIIIYGYILLALIFIYIIWRDSKKPNLFFNKNKSLGLILGITLGLGILLAIDAGFIEPNILIIKKTDIKTNKINVPVKIALVTDIQVGNHKKDLWVQKIVQKIVQKNPDLILLGGDLIDNEGNFDNEENYLEPLLELVDKYPIYYILGNHEYGIGSFLQDNPNKHTADKSEWLIKKMAELNIPFLRNNLDCLKIKEQDICIFGTDDIWHKSSLPLPEGELEGVGENQFLIFLTHNPDGILYYPKNINQPDLVLAGHTHGGQVYLPFVGPLGDADVNLPKKYWRGLNYYTTLVIPSEVEESLQKQSEERKILNQVQNLPSTRLGDDNFGIPILTSIGVGESGGQLRFLSPPTIDIITLQPKNE